MKIIIPENNTLRFVKRQYNSQPASSSWSSLEAPFNRNYFNTRFKDEIQSNRKYTLQLYAQLYGDYEQYFLQAFRNEEIKIQLLSDTELTDDSNIKLNVKTETGCVIFSQFLAKKIDNITHKILFNSAKFINYGGFRAFYFTTGTFKDYGVYPNVIESGNYYYNGEVPAWLEVDQGIDIFVGIGNPNNGSGSIAQIVYSDTYNAWVIVTNLSYVSVTESQANITITYKRSDYDVYEYSVSEITPETCVYVEITTTLTPGDFTVIEEKWESDFIYFEIDPVGGLSFLQWKQTRDKFMVDFRTGLMNFAYIPMLMYDLIPEGDAEIYTDENSGADLIDAEYKRKFKCELTAVPRHFVEKIALAIRHEYFYINGKRFVWNPGTWNQSRIEETMLYNADFEVYEPDLLGIYSDNYINTKEPDEVPKKLLIDANNHGLKIDANNELIITQ